MLNHSKATTIIEELCQKLNCSELADDLERVNYAREMLAQLQQKAIFKNLHSNTGKLKPTKSYFSGMQKVSNMFSKTKQRLDTAETSSSSIDVNISEESILSLEENILPEEEYEIEKLVECDDLPEDSWLGFFRGYEILEENQECFLSENKQCIELCLEDDNFSLGNYLRAGIRCFMIDLFLGTELDKQRLIFKLRESELKVSQEYGFPITTTLFAMLSPRLQYTGLMDASNPIGELKKGDKTVLTTKKKYTSTCNCNKIYVNARFLIDDCKEGDFILVGPSIQLMVTEVLNEELKCLVMEAGTLSSRLPVRFPARCRRLQISLEELENITFAREVGINVLVSYKPGSQQYLNELYDALRLLRCDNLRILTRLVLNEYEGEENHDLEWIAESYDGFFVDFSGQQCTKCCQTEKENSSEIPNILNFSPASVNFMTKVYNMKKPIILNPCLIAERQAYVHQYNIPHVFYYPDKFIFSSKKYNNAFLFFFLQNALTGNIPSRDVSNPFFCDISELGDDTIARACVAASLESQAKAIIVCSAWPDMSVKLSHFRPKAPIYHVSAIKSVSEYISLYHHIIFMHFPTRNQHSYAEYVINAFIFCLIFLKARNILRFGDNVVFVYATETSTKLCDKYMMYKFNEQNFAANLEEILFA